VLFILTLKHLLSSRGLIGLYSLFLNTQLLKRFIGIGDFNMKRLLEEEWEEEWEEEEWEEEWEEEEW